MIGRSGGYRGLARGLAVTGMMGAALMVMSGCSVQGPAGPGQPTASHPATGHPTTAHPTGTPTALPRASCGQATTHQLSGTTQFFRADKGALSCFATAARQCQNASIAVTAMGVDTGTKYVFAIVPGKSNCQATEWSQGYSASFGGSKHFKVVVTQCSAATKPDGVLLGCSGQHILIPVTVTT